MSFFHQTLELTDWPRLFTLSFVELALSADNAIVMGVFVRSLSPHLRKKALLIGILSAFFFRGVAILGINQLLHYFWIQILGGGYLIYLSIHYFCSSKQKLPSNVGASFWKTVALIEIFDLVFALDSILAGLALISSTVISYTINPKLWIVYVGGMIGALTIRYAATWFARLLEIFPKLETSAFLLIGWIGLKLCYVRIEPFFNFSIPYELIFWGGMLLFLLWGFQKKQTL
ncbi:MAG: hypothetical protein K2X08_00425 [Chlamydiales bacterium]|nr:hypothetical protein [Chlamydiales bacterium]